MTDIHSINLDKLRNIVQKFAHSDFTAAQIAASREQFEALLHRNAALLGIREVNATQPLRWQAMQ